MFKDFYYATPLDSLYDFSFWGGARGWFDDIVKEGGDEAVEYLESYLEECYNPLPTATEINDFIWFEAYDLLIEAGIVEEE